MRRILSLLFVLVLTISTPIFAQNGTFDLTAVIPTVTIQTRIFTTTSLPSTGGKSLPAQFVIGNGCNAMWDVRTHVWGNGGGAVKFPVIGTVNCSASLAAESGFMVKASDTVIAADLMTGGDLRANGYLIQPNAVIKKGESIPTLLFVCNNTKTHSVMSVETTKRQDMADSSTAEPLLKIFDERLKPDERAGVLQA